MPNSFALLRLGEVRFYSTLDLMGRMLTGCVEESAFTYYRKKEFSGIVMHVVVGAVCEAFT